MAIAFAKVWRWFHTSTKRSSSTQYFLSDLFKCESKVKEIEDQLTAVFNSITIEEVAETLDRRSVLPPDQGDGRPDMRIHGDAGDPIWKGEKLIWFLGGLEAFIEMVCEIKHVSRGESFLGFKLQSDSRRSPGNIIHDVE